MNDLGSANARSVGACSVLLALAAGLTSCGGGQSGSNEASGAGIESRSVSSVGIAATDEAKLIAVGADLNARELESAELAAKALRAEESVEVIVPTAKTDLTKAAATAELTVYRFFNPQSGAHFYTASVTERDQVRAQASAFSYEGPAFQASGQGGNGLSPVYRFYNASTGVHFYTISETEKSHIQQTLPQFQLEGVAYYASQVAAEGFRPLYRSFVANKGFHFYSVNASEGSGLAQYQAEGIAYYVVGSAAAVTPPADPTPVADTVCGLPNFQADLMQQINAARASARSCGAVARPATTALVWNANLQVAAARHSTDMAKNNFFSHTGSDGSNLGGRATAAGYIWRGIGENIAAGQSNVTTVMNGWLASEGHCNNIMESSFNDAALACVSQPGTTYGKYWTMELGRR
jgi:uncharacterized protein YkwD